MFPRLTPQKASICVFWVPRVDHSEVSEVRCCLGKLSHSLAIMKSGPQAMGKKPNLVMSYSVATMCREGALHVIEVTLKGRHLVIVVTAGYSGLAAGCCRVFLEPSSMVSSMLHWCPLLGHSLHSIMGLDPCSH